MNNIVAAKVLMSHLPEITDGAYKIATEIAIEVLFQDAREDWNKFCLYEDDTVSFEDYLGLNQEEYERWVRQ